MSLGIRLVPYVAYRELFSYSSILFRALRIIEWSNNLKRSPLGIALQLREQLQALLKFDFFVLMMIKTLKILIIELFVAD